MSKLKPCPFCGGGITVTYNSFSNSYNFWHKTKDCIVAEPFCLDGCRAKSINEAIEVWNNAIDTWNRRENNG